jgi:hypothetical protein
MHVFLYMSGTKGRGRDRLVFEIVKNSKASRQDT